MNDQKSLTPKQEEFAKEYVENGYNGTQAALKVYNTTDPNVAGIIAYRNLKRPNVRTYIASLRGDLYDSLGSSLLRTGALEKAVEKAAKDLENSDPKSAYIACKFILECAKILINTSTNREDESELLIIPTRN